MLEQTTIDIAPGHATMSLPARILTFLMDRQAASSREIMEALGITVETSLHGAIKRLIDQGRIERVARGRFRIAEPDGDDGRLSFDAWLKSREPGEAFRLDRVVSEVSEPYQVVTQRMETLLRTGAIGRAGRGVYSIGEGAPAADIALLGKSDAVLRIMSREDRNWSVPEVQSELKAAGIETMASQVLGNMARSGIVVRVARGTYAMGNRRRLS